MDATQTAFVSASSFSSTCVIAALLVIAFFVLKKKKPVESGSTSSTSTSTVGSQSTVSLSRTNNSSPTYDSSIITAIKADLVRLLKAPPSSSVASELIVQKGSDGLHYIVFKTDNETQKKKMAVFVEMNRRGKLLYTEAKKRWGSTDKRVQKLSKMFENLGGVSRLNETKPGWGAPACAYVTNSNKGPLVFQDYPLCDEKDCWWCSQTPPLDNQFDSYVHELGHVACADPQCETDVHGPIWFKTTSDLRTIAHALRLRSFNVRYDCFDDCGNLR